MVPQTEWMTLPLEGCRMKTIVIFGNGKDSEMVLEPRNEQLRPYRIPVRDPEIAIEIDGKVRTEIFNDGSDADLGVRYLPQEDLVFDRCRLEAIEEHPWNADPMEETNSSGEIEIHWLFEWASIRVARGTRS